MRLYRSKVDIIAREIIDRLVNDQDIEITDRTEAEQDIVSVLNEYLRLEREVTERTKDVLEARKLPHSNFGQVKRMVAGEKGLGLGNESIGWICNQILGTFEESAFIDEIFATDANMRRKMEKILSRHMMMDEEMDVEVRTRIKNLKEGTENWDIEYARVMQQIKQKRGLKS